MSYLEFRHLVPSSDEAERQRLFVDAFPELKGTSVDSLKHYLWKFRTFPSSKPAYEYLAVNSQEFLGYYAALPYSYQLSGKSALAGMVCDVMTSSQSRGQGIFTKIGHFATSEMQKMGLDFTTGYPIRPGVIPGHLKVGWKVVFPLPLYLRVFKSKNLLKKIKVSFLSPVVDIFFSLYRILSHLPAASSEYIGSVMSPEFFFQSENQYNDFFESWRKQVPNHLIKDFKFLKWRTGAPGASYRFLVIQKGKQWVAVAILRNTELQGVPSTAILDLMLLDSDKISARRLISRCLYEESVRSKTEVCAMMMSPFSAKKIGIFGMGFLRSPATFNLIIKKLNPNLTDEVLFLEKNWQLGWIDSDDL